MEQLQEDQGEKRAEFRRRTLKAGKIIFNDRKNVMDCRIRNLSDHGCHVLIPSNVDLPETFSLNLTTSNDVFQCEVIWRQLEELGVKFID